jgi:hypothetical protein
MRSLLCVLIISLATTSAMANTTLLDCVSSGAEGSMVTTLVLEKNDGSGFTAKMESAFEDGVVEFQIPSSTQTAASTQYVLKHDHDLLMTLATYQKQAVVFYQSTDGSDQSVNVEFLLCK